MFSGKIWDDADRCTTHIFTQGHRHRHTTAEHLTTTSKQPDLHVHTSHYLENTNVHVLPCTHAQTDWLISIDADLHDVNAAQPALKI